MFSHIYLFIANIVVWWSGPENPRHDEQLLWRSPFLGSFECTP